MKSFSSLFSSLLPFLASVISICSFSFLNIKEKVYSNWTKTTETSSAKWIWDQENQIKNLISPVVYQTKPRSEECF